MTEETKNPFTGSKSKPEAKVEEAVTIPEHADMNDENETVDVPVREGQQLTDMMRSPGDLGKFLEVGKKKEAILKAYGGNESDIPLNHPTYWQR